MGNKTWKVLGVIGLYAVLAWNSPVTAKAAEIEVETSTTLYAKIDAWYGRLRMRAERRLQKYRGDRLMKLPHRQKAAG